jgi:hypothetical protein
MCVMADVARLEKKNKCLRAWDQMLYANSGRGGGNMSNEWRNYLKGKYRAMIKVHNSPGYTSPAKI